MKSLLLIFSQECCFNIRKDQVHLKHAELDGLMLFYIILLPGLASLFFPKIIVKKE